MFRLNQTSTAGVAGVGGGDGGGDGGGANFSI